MSGSRENDSKRTAIAIVSFLAVIFALISVFLWMHGEKRDYHLYLLGDDLRTTPRLLVRVVSRDGYLVPDARIELDGRPTPGLIFDATRPFRTLTLTIGGTAYEYEADFGRLLEKSARRLPDAWFTEKEIQEADAAVRRIATAPKRLYAVPAAIRLFGEQPNDITLFCFTDAGPCPDERVTIGAASFALRNGIGEGTLTPSFQAEIMARFPDDTVVPFLFPYPGKMFSLEKEEGRWVARTLVDMNNIHIDCWRGDRWEVTDVVAVPPTGRPLPPHYAACDRIQVSGDPHDPGGNFLVRAAGAATPRDVADPYFRALLDDIGRHRPDAAATLLERYPAAFFRRLNVLFSSIEGEQAFEARKKEKLAVVWWLLAAVAAAGVATFSVSSYRRFTTVVGDEEEPITLSRRQQRLIVIAASAALALFFVVLLLVLRNLA
ncbi:MAG TPA: hypothetical protein P5077_03070 [bacterium]|nr:hypothetical protein [bacterium]